MKPDAAEPEVEEVDQNSLTKDLLLLGFGLLSLLAHPFSMLGIFLTTTPFFIWSISRGRKRWFGSAGLILGFVSLVRLLAYLGMLLFAYLSSR